MAPAKPSFLFRLGASVAKATAALQRLKHLRMASLFLLCATMMLLYFASQRSMVVPMEVQKHRRHMLSAAVERVECYDMCIAEEKSPYSIEKIHAMRKSLPEPNVKHESIFKAFESKRQIPFIKAAAYFSDLDPASFWSGLRLSAVDSELQRIKDDGFNAIVVVLPWTDIQPTVDPISYDQELLQKLGFLLEMAAHKGLYVIGRLGYAHNRALASPPFAAWQLSHLERCSLLLQQHPTLRDAWADLLQRLQALLARYPSTYLYSFLSWDDFACADWVWPYSSPEERVALAKKSGFQRFLAGKYSSLAAAGLELGPAVGSFEQVPVPSPQQRELRAPWGLHLNNLWWALVQEAREVLPFTTLELRMDDEPAKVDPAKPLEGSNIRWQPNDMHQQDISVTPRGAYWAPYMGAPNSNDLLSADDALRSLAWTLGKASGGGANTRVVLGQFRFTESNPQGRHHSRLDPQQLPAFLGRAADVLRNQSVGYGLWAYRAFRRNELHNGGFQRGLEGWAVEGCCGWPASIEPDNAAMYLHASSGGVRLAQSVMLPEGKCDVAGVARLCFRAQAVGSVQHVTVAWGGAKLLVQANTSSLQQTCMELPKQAEGSAIAFGLSVDKGTVLLDDVQLFCHVEQQGVYDVDGGEMALAQPVRDLNAALPQDSHVQLWAQ